MYKISGFIKDYAWGGFEFIPHLLGERATDKPAAELWFGDHPQGPSLLQEKDGTIAPLDEWITHHQDVLSLSSREKFGNHLPFLLKILDVRLPLSIQLHPNKEQAQAGFLREEKAGIARDAAERNYQDNNHKPEMMVALSEFWLLHGFAPWERIEENLSTRPSLAPILEMIKRQDLQTTYSNIMTASQAELAKWLLPLLDQPAPKEVSKNPDYWLHYTVKAMNIPRERLDAGLLSFYLFNIVRLEKGEGIFQAARLPHAYLRGQNIEIMAASNNVLRAGLTPKHIDIPELLKIIHAESIIPKIITPQVPYLAQYPAPIADFTLEVCHLLDDQSFSIQHPELMVILNIEGKAYLDKHGEQSMCLESGEAALIPAGVSFCCYAEGDCSLVFASTQSIFSSEILAKTAHYSQF